MPCSNAAKTRNQSKFAGVPKLVNRSQPLVGRRSPYYADMWRTYRCITSFFPILDMCLSCEDIARQSCAMVPRWRFWRFFASCIFSEPRAVHFRRSDLHSEIRRGIKKEKRRKKETTGQKYNGLPYSIGRPP